MRWWTIPILCVLLATDSTWELPTPEDSGLPSTAKSQVYLFYEDVGPAVFLCYGAKFREKYFLTTASCFDRFRSSGKLAIKENSIFVSSVQRPATLNGRREPIVGILEHSKYTILDNQRGKDRRYDLAIVRVSNNLDEITQPVDLPEKKPETAKFCSITAYKNELHPNYLESIRVVSIPTGDCLPKENGDKGISSMFCVQLRNKPTVPVKDEYMSSAPVTCEESIHGVVSWGYDSNKDINNLVVTSFASELKWIRDNQDKEFTFPGQADPGTTSPENPTKSTHPTKSTGATKPTDPTNPTSSVCPPNDWNAQPCYPEYGPDDSAAIQSSLGLPLLLFIVACVLKY